MSRAYKRRKKNREIGDLTYPEGGSRISCNAYKSQHKRMMKRMRQEGKPTIKPNYGQFVQMGNKLASGESES